MSKYTLSNNEIEETVEIRNFYKNKDKLIEAYLLLKSIIKLDTEFNPLVMDNPLLVLEAVNLSAKLAVSSKEETMWYGFKEPIAEYCIQVGFNHGWSKGVLYIEGISVGVASFHFPWWDNKIKKEYKFLFMEETCETWPHEWSKIYRQHLAYDIIINKNIRRLVAEATATNGRIINGISSSAVNRIAGRLSA